MRLAVVLNDEILLQSLQIRRLVTRTVTNRKGRTQIDASCPAVHCFVALIVLRDSDASYGAARSMTDFAEPGHEEKSAALKRDSQNRAFIADFSQSIQQLAAFVSNFGEFRILSVTDWHEFRTCGSVGEARKVQISVVRLVRRALEPHLDWFRCRVSGQQQASCSRRQVNQVRMHARAVEAEQYLRLNTSCNCRLERLLHTLEKKQEVPEADALQSAQ